MRHLMWTDVIQGGSKNVEVNMKLKHICNIGKFKCKCGYL